MCEMFTWYIFFIGFNYWPRKIFNVREKHHVPDYLSCNQIYHLYF